MIDSVQFLYTPCLFVPRAIMVGNSDGSLPPYGIPLPVDISRGGINALYIDMELSSHIPRGNGNNGCRIHEFGVPGVSNHPSINGPKDCMIRSDDDHDWCVDSFLVKEPFIPGQHHGNVSMEDILDYSEYQNMLSAQNSHVQMQYQMGGNQEIHGNNDEGALFINSEPCNAEPGTKRHALRSVKESQEKWREDVPHLRFQKANPRNLPKLSDLKSFLDLDRRKVFRKTTAPCSPRVNSVSSTNSTPNSMHAHDVSPVYKQDSLRYMDAISQMEALKAEHHEERSLISMASFSTVDTCGDDTYRSMSSSSSIDDFDGGVGQTYRCNTPCQPITRISSDVIKKYRGKVLAEHLFECSNGIKRYEDDIINAHDIFDIIPLPLNGPGTLGFPGQHPDTPQNYGVIDGRINHDYYRKELLAAAKAQGVGHLFGQQIEDDQPNEVASSSRPIRNTRKYPLCSKRKCGLITGLERKPRTPKLQDGCKDLSGGISNESFATLHCGSPEGNSSDSSTTYSGSRSSSPRQRRKVSGRAVNGGRSNKRKKAQKNYHGEMLTGGSDIYGNCYIEKEYVVSTEDEPGMPAGTVMVLHKCPGINETFLHKPEGYISFDYLLDMPVIAAPHPELGQDEYQCLVTGVYWDKRSWIASWYEGTRRYYNSFSARMHGFYQAKYNAIQARLSHTKNNGKFINVEDVLTERERLVKHYKDGGT